MKLVGEAFDRHVGDREQTVEDDPELFPEFIAKLCLEGFLRRREEGADRVVDEVELQPGIGSASGLAVAERVQPLERADASVEDAAPTLLFDILQAVTGQGGDDVDTLLRQENVRILLPRFEEDRQVAAIDHCPAERTGTADEIAEVGMEFGCAAGDVQRRDFWIARQQFEDAFDAATIESLRSVRSGFDVTVMARQVASQADIQLKRRNPPTPKWSESMTCDVRVEASGIERLALRPGRSALSLL